MKTHYYLVIFFMLLKLNLYSQVENNDVKKPATNNFYMGANFAAGFIEEETILCPAFYLSFSGLKRITFHTDLSAGYLGQYFAFLNFGVYGKFRMNEFSWFFIGPTVYGLSVINPKVGLLFGKKILFNIEVFGFVNPRSFGVIKGGVSIPLGDY